MLPERAQKILDEIKSLTENQGYGEIVIVIRAGSIRQVRKTVSENYDCGDQREEPGTPQSVK